MRIGIIGAGNIGGNLTRRLTAAGHDVAVANSRAPETLADLVAETGATAVTAAEAARDAEVVIVTIPLGKVAELPGDLLEGAAPGVVVIDTMNYYPRRDGRISAIEDDGLTESAWVERQLGHGVVKVFNGIYAADIVGEARPAGAPGRLALPISGDDPDAKKTVMGLLDDVGFDAVDNGTIADSWRQQPGTPSYGPKVDVAGLRAALAAASPERPVDFRG
jgi:8-hydroxy-5-deazaflavin:NADPH oxidoreductase